MRHQGLSRSAAKGAVAALLAILGAACGGTSAPPRKPEVILTTEDVDRNVGVEESEKVDSDLGVVDDPRISPFVQQVGQRVARFALERRFDYQFQIVDQDTPNAFALPGGFIYVSRGALILASTEDEVANVLAHEIVHVSARHAAARQTMMQGILLPSILAMGNLAAYSRDQEREADRLGQDLAAAAGYDPTGMETFMRKLDHSERIMLGASRLPGFLDTHPVSAERVAEAGARARVMSWTPQPGIAGGRDGYLHLLEGLSVGVPASEGVFEEERFLHPDLDFMLRFPDGWTTLNTRAAVGAFSPRRDANVYLEYQTRGDDPQKAAEEFLAKSEREGVRIAIEKMQPLTLGEAKAFRIEGSVVSGGNASVVLTWIAYRGSILRLTGAAPSSAAASRYHGTFVAVARSFRPLPEGWRSRIEEERLRVEPAHAGESLQAFSQRTGNGWDLLTTAVVNGIFSDASLHEGELLKIAVTEAYAPETTGE